MSSSPEFSTRHEAVPDNYFDELINHVAPYESKLAVATILASRPDTYFSGSDLQKELTERQDPYPGWVPNEKTLSVYCSESFAAMNLVDTLETTGKLGRTVSQYRIASDKAPILLGLTGRLMAWGLKHKHQSTQQLFGSTQSDSISPMKTRYQIYTQLINQPEGITVENLSKNIRAKQSIKPIRSQLIIRHINELQATGVIDVNPPSNTLKTTQTLTIKDDHLQPLTDLYTLLEDFKTDPTNSDRINYALSFINDSFDLSRLMKKGRDFSARATATEQGRYRLDEQALKVLASGVGNMTVRLVREKLEENGRIIGEDAARNALNRLVTAGLAESTEARLNPDSQHTGKAYSVKPETE